MIKEKIREIILKVNNYSNILPPLVNVEVNDSTLPDNIVFRIQELQVKLPGVADILQRKRKYDIDINPRIKFFREDESVRWAKRVMQTSETTDYMTAIHNQMFKERNGICDDDDVNYFFCDAINNGIENLEVEKLLALFILTDFYKQNQIHLKSRNAICTKLEGDCALYVDTFVKNDLRKLLNDKLLHLFTHLFVRHIIQNNEPYMNRLFPLLVQLDDKPLIIYCKAWCYLNGIGVARNEDKGVELLLIAGDQGVVAARHDLNNINGNSFVTLK